MKKPSRIQPSTDVTLADIAKVSGVSVSIVSRVLRNRVDRIPDATREKVREAADKLGYRRNLLIRGVQTGRSMNIGVIMPQTDHFTSRIASGIHDELLNHDYCMFLASVPKNTEMSVKSIRRKIVHSLVDRRVDGIILHPTTTKASDVYYSEVVERKIPLLTLGRQLPDLECDFSGTDDLLGGRLAARELIEAGHRNLVHITTDSPFSPAKLRREGFEKECTEAEGIRFRTIMVEEKDNKRIEETTSKILARNDRPTAISMHVDNLMLPILRASKKLNLRIPEDLSLIGFGNLPQNEIYDPPLSSIDQNPYEIGQAAARMILQRIEENDKEAVSHLTVPKLVRRGSVAPPQT